MSFYALDSEPVYAGGVTVTPRSHVLSIRLQRAGFAWQFPTSVLVEQAGHTRRVGIVDVTMIVRLALVGVLLLALAARR